MVAIRHHSMEPVAHVLNEASLPETLSLAKVVQIEINQTDLYENGRLTNPVDAARRQKDFINRLSEVRNSEPTAALGYFGIAHIRCFFMSDVRF